ncbi:MAG: HAD family hydrolase [Candidatus Heimdallarchaeota archaeon]
MSFRCLIFDVDGTLVNNTPLIIELYQELFWKYKQVKISPEEVIGMFGPPDERIIAEHLPDAKDEAMQYLLEQYETRHPEIGYFSQQDLDALREKEYLLTIFTGKGRSTLDITLKKLHFNDYFDFIVCGTDVSRSKPFPDGLLRIVDAMKIPKEEALFIGDSPLDVAAARKASISVVGALWGSIEKKKLRAIGPDYLFEEPAALLRWLKNPTILF